ncbi:hypothetical protein GQ53DRAFT_747402 [Thozetella sp. PMI_491]|nr:hypothetical protein GQ53DRAFT_747402 [Thozetella sp. PMI_491]
MASFPSSWIVKKAPQLPPSPTLTPTRPVSPAAAPAKPRVTHHAGPSPSSTPTRHLSPSPLVKPTPRRADDTFPFPRPRRPSTPRSPRRSLVFCRDGLHVLRDIDHAILPNGPCGKPGCCGDEVHPAAFLCPDCLEDDSIDGGEGLALGRAKPLPKQSPFTGHRQDAPPVFPSSWIVRSTPAPTPVLSRKQALPHDQVKALGGTSASVPLMFSIPPSPPLNPSSLRSVESLVAPPTSAGYALANTTGKLDFSRQSTAAGASHLSDEYLWELKGKPAKQEEIGYWLQSTPGAEPRKRTNHWFKTGSDASGDADEPHSRMPVSDAYSEYSISTQNTRRLP